MSPPVEPQWAILCRMIATQTLEREAEPGANSRPHRTGVRLPKEVGAAVRELAAARNHDLSGLLLSWAYLGTITAIQGREMPASRMIPSSPDDDYLRWYQSSEEAARWTAIVRDCGSSMRAVIFSCAELYLAADGDLLRMTELGRAQFKRK